MTSFSILGAWRADAQAACAIGVAPEETRIAWRSPLDRRISLRLTDVPLRDALDRVASASRVRLSYSRELLPPDRRVCLDPGNAPVGAILAALLRDSELEAVALGGDQVVISRRAARAARAEFPGADTLERIHVVAPVVVTAPSTRAGAGLGAAALVETISGAELERDGIRTLADILEHRLPGGMAMTPGVSSLAARHGGIRGASSFGGAVPKLYIDGIEVANPRLAIALDPTMIERVEIIRGPQGAALHGSDALDGVVSITTRHDGSSGGRVDVDLYTSGGVETSRLGSSRLFTQSHSLALRSGAAARSLALAVSGDESGAYLPGTGMREFAALLTARSAGPQATIGVTARLAAMDARSVIAGAPVEGGGLADPTAPLVREGVHQYTLGLTAEMPGGDWRHSLTAGIDGYRLTRPLTFAGGIPAPAGADMALPSSSIRASFRTRSARDLVDSDRATATITFGAEHTMLRESSASVHVATDIDGAGGASDAESGDNFWTRRLGGRTSTGILSQLDLTVQDALFLTAGLRLEKATAEALAAPIAALPMIGTALVGRAGDLTVRVRGAYGRGIRAPRTLSAQEMSQGWRASGWTPRLMPERQSGFEAGVDVLAGRLFSLQVTRFDQLASGLQQRVATGEDGEPGTDHRYVSVGEIGNRGWEVQPSLAVGRVSVSASVSLTDSRVLSVADEYDGDLRPGDRMLGVPAMTAGLTLAYDARHGSASVGLSQARNWVGYDVVRLRSAAAEPDAPVSLRDAWVTYEGATDLRATVSREVGPRLTVTLAGENLLGHAWGAPDNGTLVPGRSTMVQFRFRF